MNFRRLLTKIYLNKVKILNYREADNWRHFKRQQNLTVFLSWYTKWGIKIQNWTYLEII